MTTRHTEIYSGKAKRRVIYGVQYLFLIVVSIVCVFPFLWMLIGATNKSMDITLGKMSLGNQFFNNLKNLLEAGDLLTCLKNSAVLSVFITVFEYVDLLFCGLRLCDLPEQKEGVLFLIDFAVHDDTDIFSCHSDV